MIWPDPRLSGAGGSLGCKARRTPASTATGTTAFEKVGDIGPHFFQSVDALRLQRWQVFHARIVERCEARARSARLFVISLDEAVRVEIIFDDRQPCFPRRADRLRGPYRSPGPGRACRKWCSGNPPIIMFPRVKPPVLRRSMRARISVSCHGMAGPPMATWSTPNCFTRRIPASSDRPPAGFRKVPGRSSEGRRLPSGAHPAPARQWQPELPHLQPAAWFFASNRIS